MRWLALLLVSCNVAPIHLSHATAPHDGQEWHSCADGTECAEGYACTSLGCEWCGADYDPIETRCTNGND